MTEPIIGQSRTHVCITTPKGEKWIPKRSVEDGVLGLFIPCILAGGARIIDYYAFEQGQVKDILLGLAAFKINPEEQFQFGDRSTSTRTQATSLPQFSTAVTN